MCKPLALTRSGLRRDRPADLDTRGKLGPMNLIGRLARRKHLHELHVLGEPMAGKVLPIARSVPIRSTACPLSCASRRKHN